MPPAEQLTIVMFGVNTRWAEVGGNLPDRASDCGLPGAHGCQVGNVPLGNDMTQPGFRDHEIVMRGLVHPGNAGRPRLDLGGGSRFHESGGGQFEDMLAQRRLDAGRSEPAEQPKQEIEDRANQAENHDHALEGVDLLLGAFVGFAAVPGGYAQEAEHDGVQPVDFAIAKRRMALERVVVRLEDVGTYRLHGRRHFAAGGSRENGMQGGMSPDPRPGLKPALPGGTEGGFGISRALETDGQGAVPSWCLISFAPPLRPTIGEPQA